MSQNSNIPDEFICPISQTLMRDPVTLNCGHTFDRESLQNWFIVNQLCPNCRKPVASSHALTTNYILKSLIERGNRPYSSASLREEVVDENENQSIDTKCLEETWASFFRQGNGINLQIHTPEMTKRRPVAFVCVIDVSGSMGSAVGAGEAGTGKAYSRLDLVKHVLNVLIACLKDQDKLALIAFSDEPDLVMSLTSMTQMNKAFAKTAVQILKPQMNTYMAPAIKKAFDILGDASLSSNYLKSIILLTDGQDTVGEAYVKKSFESIARPPRIQFSTFGFGNDLTSALLQQLAVSGGGIFGFIPDQSMIGTIFVNYMANTFLTMAQDVIIDVGPNYELNEHDSPKACLQYGRERHYLLKRKDGARSNDFDLRLGFDEKTMLPIKIKEDSAGSAKSFEIYQTQLAKYKMLDLVMNKKLPKIRIDDYIESNEIKNVANFWHELKQEDNENDPNNEQIRLSLVYWSTWGAHYMRSFGFAHILEQCLNFKSPSMKTYQSDRFNDLVFKLTDLFVTLPPPPPSTQSYKNMPTVTMHSIMDVNNGCILPSCLVRTIDGQTKMIGSLRKGDVLESGGVVKCLVLSHYNGALIKLGNSLAITPYHPVRIDKKWTFPKDVKDAGIIELEEQIMVCNLVLDRTHIVNVGGIDCVTLGHGMQDDDVVKHPYYGTNRVIDDLMQLDGWDNGLIVLKEYKVSRDENGFVNSTFGHRFIETF